MSADEMHKVFAEWNEGDLDSYLIEITRDILAFKDDDGAPMVDKILDTAGQKGTGKWTVINSAELGIPITLIGEAVFSRCISAMKEERVAASKKLRGPKPTIKTNREKFIDDIRSALLRLENHLVRTGLHAAPRSSSRVRLEAQLRRDRPHVARRLHHSQPVPRQNQGGIRQAQAAAEPAARPALQARDPKEPARLA